MDTIINLTPSPAVAPLVSVPVGSPTNNQAIWEALDVSSSDVLDLEVGLINFTGTQSTAISIQLITGMQMDTDDASWVQPATTISTFATALTLPYWTKVSVKMGFLQFLRWTVVSYGGATTITFAVRGVGRSLY